VKWKKALTEPSFWILLAANIYLVYKYEQDPDIFSTIIWLYWSQNILYGFFNFLDILTTKKADLSTQLQPSLAPEDLPGNEKRIISATAWTFLFHFGFFHVVYLFFLFSMTSSARFDWTFFKYYLLVFLVFQVINFTQHKIQNRNRAMDIGKMFFTPYLRVIPMHLCILIPAFLHLTSLTVFLVLKVIADVFMFVITNNYYQKSPAAEVTALNIESMISPE
jgi:hypothetical protein